MSGYAANPNLTSRTSTPDRHIGTILSGHENTRTCRNLDDTALDKWTLTVGGAVTQVKFTPPGGSLQTYTVSASSAQGIVDDLRALDDCVIEQWGDLSVSGADVIWLARDQSYTASFTATTNLSVDHTRTGSLGSDIPLAKPVRRSATLTGAGCRGLVAVKPVDGLTPQVMTLTLVYSATATYHGTVVLKGYDNGQDRLIPLSAAVLANTDSATTATDFAAQVNADMPSETVVAAATAGGALTLTSEIDGLTFEFLWSTAVVEAGTVAKAYTTGRPNDPDNDLRGAIVGIIAASSAIQLDGSGDPVLPKGEDGTLFTGPGEIIVPTTDTIAFGEPVSVKVAASGAGTWGNANGTDLLVLPYSMAHWVAAEKAGESAVLFFNANG